MKIFLLFFFVSIASLAPIFAPGRSDAAPGMQQAGFVYVTQYVPDAILEIRYHGEDNFMGRRAAGYDAPLAVCAERAAQALARAADDLRAQGYRLKIFDAYRPLAAVRDFAKWGDDLDDVKMKARFYPDVEKADLFRRGYIARGRSGHSRGGTIDLTLVHAESGEELDMGSPFDFFGEISHHGSALVGEAQARNRRILRNAMERAGFRALGAEWWHYTLKDEPYPDRYFDFPITYNGSDWLAAGMLDELVSVRDLRKILVVLGERAGPRATVYAFERTGRGGYEWSQHLRTEGVTGMRGVWPERGEGSKRTPAGIFSLGMAFGVAGDPGAGVPYTRLQPGDLWVDDPGSRYYNRFVRGAGDANKAGKADKNPLDRDWKSAEDLFAEKISYKYAVALNFNTDPVVPGLGSAIFLHCTTKRSAVSGTAGCIAVPEAAMLRLLRWIDDETKIVVVGTPEEFFSF